MRRIVFTVLAVFMVSLAFAQNDSVARPKPRAQREVPSNDHFMIQIGHTSWTGKPDSIKTKGWNRAFNFYVMLNFPFKTNPHWSVAIGPGISTENIYFDKMYVGIKDRTAALQFRDVSDTQHFKKYKLATAYLEAPVELRYRFNPDNDKRSVKIAVGAKVATLLNAHVKGKELRAASETTVNNYTQKENSKQFFNKTRLSVTARAGYGHFSLFASYGLTPIFREGTAPTMRPLTIGLTLSGL